MATIVYGKLSFNRSVSFVANFFAILPLQLKHKEGEQRKALAKTRPHTLSMTTATTAGEKLRENIAQRLIRTNRSFAEADKWANYWKDLPLDEDNLKECTYDENNGTATCVVWRRQGSEAAEVLGSGQVVMHFKNVTGMERCIRRSWRSKYGSSINHVSFKFDEKRTMGPRHEFDSSRGFIDRLVVIIDMHGRK